MSASQPSISAGANALLEHVAREVRTSGLFGEVAVKGSLLEAAAKDSAEPAAYRLTVEGDTLWVSLVTANRWLSQSIEQDLVHTGDKLDDLLQEELVDLGYTGPAPRFEHFRSEDKLFTFRTVVPVNIPAPSAADRETAVRFLMAYEACFRQLGDMEADDEE